MTSKNEDDFVVPDHNNLVVDLQVIGLNTGDSGKSCSNHKICGSTVVVGSLVRFLLTITMAESDKYTYAIGVYVIFEAETTCLVGFLDGNLLPFWTEYEDRMAQVIYVERDKENEEFGTCIVRTIPVEIGVDLTSWNREDPMELPSLTHNLISRMCKKLSIYIDNLYAAQMYLKIATKKSFVSPSVSPSKKTIIIESESGTKKKKSKIN